MSTVHVVIDAFVGTENGEVRLRAGEEYDASDPLVTAHPDLFTEVEGQAATPVKKTTPKRK